MIFHDNGFKEPPERFYSDLKNPLEFFNQQMKIRGVWDIYQKSSDFSQILQLYMITHTRDLALAKEKQLSNEEWVELFKAIRDNTKARKRLSGFMCFGIPRSDILHWKPSLKSLSSEFPEFFNDQPLADQQQPPLVWEEDFVQLVQSGPNCYMAACAVFLAYNKKKYDPDPDALISRITMNDITSYAINQRHWYNLIVEAEGWSAFDFLLQCMADAKDMQER